MKTFESLFSEIKVAINIFNVSFQQRRAEFHQGALQTIGECPRQVN
jgi:hypothetical protein